MGVYRRKREETEDPELLQYIASSKPRQPKETDTDQIEYDSSIYEPPPDIDASQAQPDQRLIDVSKVFPPGYGPVPGETTFAKLLRKTKQNPFVPFGTCVVLGSFGYGIQCMRAGKSEMSNKMMRLRILSTVFTISAIIIGGYYESYKINKYREEWKQSHTLA